MNTSDLSFIYSSNIEGNFDNSYNETFSPDLSIASRRPSYTEEWSRFLKSFPFLAKNEPIDESEASKPNRMDEVNETVN